MTAVVIVDDQEATRLGLSLQLKRQPGITVIGTAVDGLDAVGQIDELVSGGRIPDVVLMDVRMPRLNGVEATRRITRKWPFIRVLVLTTFDQDDYAFGSLRAGASGFLLKDAPASELIAGIQAVAAGDACLSPRITGEVIQRADLTDVHDARGDHPGHARSIVKRLTAREEEILTAIGRGLTNQEIATAFVLSPATVKTYVTRLLAKCDQRDRVGLVILAYESGLLHG
ncbi:two component transcriptional regulator, LuxR family [Austwickia chelonae]|uniref:Putative two-component response regulator n=1 Tax=Austwickia chelonae NBRC 105200 TaxID=1184607 RepID=K6UNA9_9MICO|nr:response regulator transcription factor [Austwickia chelonae]GAB78826.1 putative two-component response regulator [Austwickia chelonae NBRC 105200]SEV84902.1 two component transcriptional regulator, LuxR family [Austwickia chelonae]